ncbi:putative capsular polysaccharide synthesis family protein [Flavimaricola marinus]|uniref:Putative capsular polysaccharide synthesis protein n=1 Tax=Flavimaricola marinus TaxID=1819565 RepID=A0A238LI47_9RHOB|nr:putative capsular polysaccharide synthesis family protein [Flavimaricola marinus]SMY09213.1 Putative capsular polysaccharide synthesis protein [Flavimaricola marinus]
MASTDTASVTWASPAVEEKHLVPVVYTMGKVASSSTSTAILKAGLPCHDIHTLEPDSLRETAQSWLARNEFPPPHICVSMAHRDRLLIKRQRCLYITLVRDPLARNLSAFFQNLDQQNVEIREEQDVMRMFENFQKTYAHSTPLSWFDREFKGQLGIDVFSRPFDIERRAIHLKSANTIIFRVDCPDFQKSQILSRILGRKIDIQRANDSENKEYNDLYKRVKQVSVFNHDFVYKMYASKFARHFWTDAERNEMARRWMTPQEAEKMVALPPSFQV